MMKLDKNKFDAIFNSTVKNLDASMNYEDLMKKYSNENSNISTDKMAMFAYVESINYSQQLIYRLFSELLSVED